MTNFTSQLKQFEIQEAKKRMGTFGGANAGTGFQNAASNAGVTSGSMANLNNSISVNSGEVQKVQQDMNQSSFQNSAGYTAGYTSGAYGTMPSLSDSTAVNSGEIQKVKQDMNKSYTSMY